MPDLNIVVPACLVGALHAELMRTGDHFLGHDGGPKSGNSDPRAVSSLHSRRAGNQNSFRRTKRAVDPKDGDFGL